MSDIGSSCGPALLSFLAATLSLGSGIAVTGLIAFARRGSWPTGFRGPRTRAGR